MIVVIFEAIPHAKNKQEYFDIALELKPLLAPVQGFISIERFQSLNDPAKILSLSFWENEQAVQQWRTEKLHRMAQAKGRRYIFRNYRIRIAEVKRDYGLNKREQSPTDSNQYHSDNC